MTGTPEQNQETASALITSASSKRVRASAPVAMLTAATVAAGALSGCSAPAPTSSGPGLEESVGYSAPRWNALLHKYDTSVVTCMRSRGFSYWSPVDWQYQTAEPHGLFGRPTPAAVMEYRLLYGYGVTHRVDVLKAEVVRNKSQWSNAAYVQSLTPKRQRDYNNALAGTKATPGCAHPAHDAVLALQLPDGGKLGEAFSDALDHARDNDEYREWEADVVGCLRAHAIAVPDKELANVERAFLVRLLDLMGVKYSTNRDGDVVYEYSAQQASRVDPELLKKLRDDERAAATVEVRCRRDAGSGAQEAVDSYSAVLVPQYRDDVALLRRALTNDEGR